MHSECKSTHIAWAVSELQCCSDKLQQFISFSPHHQFFLHEEQFPSSFQSFPTLFLHQFDVVSSSHWCSCCQKHIRWGGSHSHKPGGHFKWILFSISIPPSWYLLIYMVIFQPCVVLIIFTLIWLSPIFPEHSSFQWMLCQLNFSSHTYDPSASCSSMLYLLLRPPLCSLTPSPLQLQSAS